MNVEARALNRFLARATSCEPLSKFSPLGSVPDCAMTANVKLLISLARTTSVRGCQEAILVCNWRVRFTSQQIMSAAPLSFMWSNLAFTLSKVLCPEMTTCQAVSHVIEVLHTARYRRCVFPSRKLQSHMAFSNWQTHRHSYRHILHGVCIRSGLTLAVQHCCQCSVSKN